MLSNRLVRSRLDAQRAVRSENVQIVKCRQALSQLNDKKWLSANEHCGSQRRYILQRMSLQNHKGQRFYFLKYSNFANYIQCIGNRINLDINTIIHLGKTTSIILFFFSVFTLACNSRPIKRRLIFNTLLGFTLLTLTK